MNLKGMHYHFCTITSSDYLPFVQTLLHSLSKQSDQVTLHVLITDNQKPTNTASVFFYLPNELQGEAVVHFVRKYGSDNNKLRWGLKPFFLSHLLRNYAEVIYLDNDIYFFKPFNFLFEQLQHHSLLLTPHWFAFEPYPFEENFMTSYQIGLFNAGFVGASSKAIKILKWWTDVCLYNMERNLCKGFFDDQRYLDSAIIIDEDVGIVRHLGCNIGSWNFHQNKRTKREGKVLINDKYPIVFVHFNDETIKHILNGNDILLKPHFEEYKQAFSLTGHHFHEFKNYKSKIQPLIKLKRKLIIRTRVKNFLFRLSQKL